MTLVTLNSDKRTRLGGEGVLSCGEKFGTPDRFCPKGAPDLSELQSLIFTIKKILEVKIYL